MTENNVKHLSWAYKYSKYLQSDTRDLESMIMTKLAIVYIQTVYRKKLLFSSSEVFKPSYTSESSGELKTTNNLNLRMDFSGFTTNLLESQSLGSRLENLV